MRNIKWTNDSTIPGWTSILASWTNRDIKWVKKMIPEGLFFPCSIDKFSDYSHFVGFDGKPLRVDYGLLENVAGPFETLTLTKRMSKVWYFDFPRDHENANVVLVRYRMEGMRT